MKINRRIKAVLCCMALAGVLIFDMFPVQAASCSHKMWQTFYDVKTYYYEEDGHYGDCCTSYICADCGYQYWGDDVEYRKIGDHEWTDYLLIPSDEDDRYYAWCTTPGCDWEKIEIYTKAQ